MTELRCPRCGNTTRFSVGQWVLLDRYGQLEFEEGKVYRYANVPSLAAMENLATDENQVGSFELGDIIEGTEPTLIMCVDCNDPATGIGTVVYHDAREPEIVLTEREGK